MATSLKQNQDGSVEINIPVLFKNAEAERKERETKQTESMHNHFKKLSDKHTKERSDVIELSRKAFESERKEAEVKRAEEMALEKQRMTAEIEAKYNDQGVKSEAEKIRDAAYRKLLTGSTDPVPESESYETNKDKAYRNFTENLFKK
ncbi:MULTISPECIES: hypothetical protein [Lactococcus]|uniref:hypothetical protein n=1 Tax=Lactococcus TaxID=1357 RepID=UPI000ECD1607|nr:MULTISPECIES: hypothetical protein [Lactococcus]HAP15814.1 hypothetical protein [Lactococcus sp.]